MKKKIIGILLCMLLIATAVPALGTTPSLKLSDEKSNSSSHEVEIEWEYKYGGVNDDVFRNVKQTTDGGYITVGVWNSTSHWLVKLDENGHEEWDATALPNSELWPRCYIVEQTSDGGYITAGCHEDNAGIGYDRCIWKVDENGETEWLKIYDDPLHGYHMCIQETSDGGYIVGGEIDVSTIDWDVLLMKTDSVGNVEWQKIWSYGNLGDNAYAVRQTPDGGYILSGRTGISSSNREFLVIKTDSNGNIEWNKTYGGTGIDWSQSNDILITDDGYIFLAQTNSFGAGYEDVWLIKTDKDGNMLWNKTFGGKRTDMCGGMDFTDDGGIIIAASTNSFDLNPPGGEGFVVKTDENGNTMWQYSFGYEAEDQIQSVFSTSDGNFIFAGLSTTTGTSGFGLYDGWLIKIKDFENNPPDKPDKPSGKKKITPGAVYTYKTSSSDSDGDQVYYCWDWDDGAISDWLGPYDSGVVCEAEHFWEEDGNYSVIVIAKDSYGRESEWSEGLRVTTPKNKASNFNFLLLNWLFEKFPNIFPALKYLLGL